MNQLANIQPRLRRPLIRPVSQVNFELTDTGAFARGIEECVAWMDHPRRCNGRIPAASRTGEPFDLGYQAGTMPASSTFYEKEGRRVWAARLDFPDEAVGQRTWSTEIVIVASGNRTRFSSRLTNITLGDNPPYSPSVPGIVHKILSTLSAEADEFGLSDEATEIAEPELDDFVRLLISPDRRLPIVALSVDDNGRSAVDANLVIRRIAGAAHVICLTPDASWGLTRRLGRRFSVFNGAARLYGTQFDVDRDDPYRHALHLPSDDEDNAQFGDWVSRRVLPSTFVQHGEPHEDLRFADVKAAASALARGAERRSGETDNLKTVISSLEESLDALTRQRSEDAEAAQSLLEEAAEAQALAERERDEIASENERLRAKLRAMSFGAKPAKLKPARLEEFSNFEAWADSTLGERIEILPRAIRETEKHGAVELIEVFQDTLLMIRDFYVPMRLKGGNAYQLFQARCKELSVEESACFAQKDAIKAFPEYRASYGRERIWLDRHFKYGAGYDLRRMFRIYYHWHEQDQLVIVGHMPTHLDNKNTQ